MANCTCASGPTSCLFSSSSKTCAEEIMIDRQFKSIRHAARHTQMPAHGKMMNKDHVSPTNAGILLPVPEKERLLLQEGQRGSGQQVEVLKISKQIDWK
ncbi:hypothetical protein OUZ56_013859 [Daphnia magna]|uniref:Uncharacterized protein n=1 Tax=Daphnia magna TaxID=35525 RepID=A0ABQ9Z772_9CRUS|nr:hypothetical protein OUZ56_013859 [Daphnia magna]